MMDRRHQANLRLRSAVMKNVGLALLLVVAENLLIFSNIGFSSAGTRGGGFIAAIPGWVIGLVWTALFGGIGIARGVMLADGSASGRRAAKAMLILLIACAAYPFYTVGLHDEIIGLFGNALTMCLAAWAAMRLWLVRRVAAIAPLAVLGWVAFASLALIEGGNLSG